MIAQFWIERMSLQTPVWSDLISLYPTVNDICQSTSHVDPSPYMSIMHHFHCWQLSIPNAHDNRSCDYAPKKQRAFICSTGIFVSSGNMWNDLITACSALLQPKQSSLCLLCLNIFCVIISYFLPNSIVLQKFFKARFFTLISRHFFWDDRNSHGDICEESHFFSKGLSIGVWAVSLQSLHISSHLFHHLLGPSVLFW